MKSFLWLCVSIFFFLMLASRWKHSFLHLLTSKFSVFENSAFWTMSRAHSHHFKAAVERFRFELTFACPLPPCVFQEKDSPMFISNTFMFIRVCLSLGLLKWCNLIARWEELNGVWRLQSGCLCNVWVSLWRRTWSGNFAETNISFGVFLIWVICLSKLGLGKIVVLIF